MQLALPEYWILHSIFERRATETHSVAREKWGHTGVKVVNTLDAVLQDPDVDVVSWRIPPPLMPHCVCQPPRYFRIRSQFLSGRCVGQGPSTLRVRQGSLLELVSNFLSCFVLDG